MGRDLRAVFLPGLGDAEGVSGLGPGERAEADTLRVRVVFQQELIGRHVDDGIGGLAGKDVHAQ